MNQEYESCNPNLENNQMLNLSEEVQREIAIHELRAVCSRALHDKEYLQMYNQICRRLER